MLPKSQQPARRRRDQLRLAHEPRCVLVTGAGGAAGRALTAQLVARGLEVHCADSRPISLPDATCHLMPAPASPGFLPALARIIQRHSVDLVIPASSASLPAISIGRLSLGVDVVVPGPGPTGTAHDRLLTAWSLWKHGVSVPDFGVPTDFADVEAALEVMGGQMMLRSRWASGERLATVVNGANALDWSALSDDWMVQHFVPGAAYSVVVYRPLDGKGRLTTVLMESVNDEGVRSVERVREGDVTEVERVAQAAVRALGLTGPVEVGIRCRADGAPQVLDVKASFGRLSPLVPEVLDAVLRDHPAPSKGTDRAGGDVVNGGLRMSQGRTSRMGAVR